MTAVDLFVLGWFGLMAIVVFSIYLQWFPPGGLEDITTVNTGIWRVSWW